MSRPDNAAQLGFETLLADADSENRAHAVERETGHLPGTMDAALPFYRQLIRDHHAAMLAADIDEVIRLRKEARKLALRLNGGEGGILAHDDAPARVLERETAATDGAVPLWGQTGAFLIAPGDMRVRIAIDGIFGIGAGSLFWPGFSAHAADWDEPFLSSTGYRSFLGVYADPEPGMTPDAFARAVIGAYIKDALKDKPVMIDERYRAGRGSSTCPGSVT
jgi:hypothetical protein